MAKRRRPITQEDIRKAREVVERFGDLSISHAPVSDVISLIKIFYAKIGDKPIEEIADQNPNQLYKVAESVYNRSFDIIQEHDPAGKSILRSINAMKRASGEERESLDERVCIGLEGNNVPTGSYLSRKYEEIKRLPF